jgi:pre-mRNA-splicing factor RBM22/SLT11
VQEFQLHQRVKEGENGSSFTTVQPSDLLQRLQRNTPYYKRNQARVCSFFAKGACTRCAPFH